MKLKSLTFACFGAVAIAAAAYAADAKKPDAAAMQLPPGWTAEEMERCIAAATPGKSHERLKQDVGTWTGKGTFWMAPGLPPVTSELTSVYTPVLDGRYVKCEMSGDMPGMGPFVGEALFGFDNVSQKYVASMVDNHSTGIMQGEGKLTDDGKTINWEYVVNCPREQKPVNIRQVETNTSATEKSLEMFGTDPKSGKEFKMMSIEFTKK
jgi:hypothetical protein